MSSNVYFFDDFFVPLRKNIQDPMSWRLLTQLAKPSGKRARNPVGKSVGKPWDTMEWLVDGPVPIGGVCNMIQSYTDPKCFHCRQELTFRAKTTRHFSYHRACYKKLFDEGRRRCLRCHGFKRECCMRKCPFYTERCDTCVDRRDLLDEYCVDCFGKTSVHMKKFFAKSAQ